MKIKFALLLLFALLTCQQGWSQLFGEKIETQRDTFSPLKPRKEHGVWGIAELGYGVGLGTYGMNNARLHITGVYKFNPYVAAGVGVGFKLYYGDWFAPDLTSEQFLSFYSYCQASFINRTISPFVGAKGGYSFEARSEEFSSGGFFINPSIGIRFKIKQRFFLSASIGYELQYDELFQMRNKDDLFFYYHRENIGGLTFGVAFEF